MSAETIATLDRVCVHHRQRRLTTSGTRSTTGVRHFDIFEQYDRVFTYLDSHPELAHWRPVLFRRMVDHVSTVFVERGRLPRASRADFLRKSRDHYRRYRTPGARIRVRTRLRHALVRLGTHRIYRLLSLASSINRRALKLSSKLIHRARGAALRLHYRVQRRLPLRADRAVFSSHRGRGHGCNPGALESAFRTFAPHIRTTWIARPEHHHTIPASTRRVRPGSAAYWTALARSSTS